MFGYLYQFEDKESLRAGSTPARLLFQGDLPVRVDPRSSPLWKDGWLEVENQANMGSCQGHALSECLEYCHPIVTGRILPFSRVYAYIRSQMFDGIKGDSGSTLEGGTKAAKEGICPEEFCRYPSSYPGWSYITDEMKVMASKYRLNSYTEITSADHMQQYIGSGAGIVQIGVSWLSSLEPDANGCIRSFSGRSVGGHSVVFCGYVPDSDVGQKSSSGVWFLMKNSWGSRWGKGGFAYVDSVAVNQMIHAKWSTFIGRSDMVAPNPRPLPVDFTKESLLG